MSDETDRERLLHAALVHVPFDGWTAAAIRAGARDLGMESAVAGNLFPGGGRELVAFHSRDADRRMLAALEGMDLAEMRVRDRVAAAIRTRLEQNAADGEAIRRAVAFLAQPQNGLLALRCLYRTVDAIWHAAGDTATDYNFYTKRLLLAGVYSSTLLYWLNDRSEGKEDTWRFLDHRISDALKLGARGGKAMSKLLSAPEALVRLRERRPSYRRRYPR
jgi:ubiquinone biosynthesis protein COQ9